MQYAILPLLVMYTGCITATYTILDHLQHYAVSPQVAAILDRQSSTLFKKLKDIDRRGAKHGVWTFKELPNYYVKYGLSRIWGLELMQRVIDEHHLDLITLPDKRIYHLKERPLHVNNTNYCVVVQKVHPTSGKQHIHKELMRQIITLIRETKYMSLERENYFHINEGKICIIDTESNYDAHLEIKAYLSLLGYGHNPAKDFSEDALKLLFTEMKRLADLERDRSATRNVIKEALGYLQHHQPHTWDYSTYFKKYFAEFL